MEKEDKRQLVHIAIGIAAVVLLLSIQRPQFVAVTFAIILLGLLLINLRFLDKKLEIVEKIVGLFFTMTKRKTGISVFRMQFKRAIAQERT